MKKYILSLLLITFVGCSNGRPFQYSELVGWFCVILFGSALFAGLVAISVGDNGRRATAASSALVALIASLIILA